MDTLYVLVFFFTEWTLVLGVSQLGILLYRDLKVAIDVDAGSSVQQNYQLWNNFNHQAMIFECWNMGIWNTLYKKRHIKLGWKLQI